MLTTLIFVGTVLVVFGAHAALTRFYTSHKIGNEIISDRVSLELELLVVQIAGKFKSRFKYAGLNFLFYAPIVLILVFLAAYAMFLTAAVKATGYDRMMNIVNHIIAFPTVVLGIAMFAIKYTYDCGKLAFTK